MRYAIWLYRGCRDGYVVRQHSILRATPLAPQRNMPCDFFLNFLPCVLAAGESNLAIFALFLASLSFRAVDADPNAARIIFPYAP